VWIDPWLDLLEQTHQLQHEGMHTDFACLLFSHLKHQAHPNTVKHIITDAVAIEQEFLTGTLLFSFNYSSIMQVD
jgi:hypothetical protein